MTSPAVLVTGASRGLGRSICIELAARGAVVWGLARDAVELAETGRRCADAGGRFEPLVADVTDPVQVEATLVSAPDLMCCILVAGIAQWGALDDPATSQLVEHFRVNVESTYRVAVHAMRRMPAGARMITIASDASHVPIGDLGAYVASKHALSGLMQTFAIDNAASGIHFTIAYPGPIDTAILPPRDAEPGPRMNAQDVGSLIAELALRPSDSVEITEVRLQPKGRS